MLNRKVLFFMGVVETGSFSGAAKKFYLSQSAISQQINQLEGELRVQLLDRSGYRPVLTETGKYYYQECKKLMDCYDLLLKNMKEIGSDYEKGLKIGITGPIEQKHLPIIINQYKSKYKDVIVDVKKINFENGVSYLLDGTLDVAFGIANDFDGNDKICKVKLMKHRVCVVCSKDHPWAKRTSVNSQEIANQPLISFSKNMGSNFYLDFIQSFKKDGVTPNIVQEVEGLEELFLAVKINQGIALTSREVVTNEDNVCQLDIDNTHHHADFCLGYLKKNNKDFLKAFIEDTRCYFKQSTL
ncbi:MAG: LysR substrate-binding domain-containing protein [Lachnotalea sp.]